MSWAAIMIFLKLFHGIIVLYTIVNFTWCEINIKVFGNIFLTSRSNTKEMPFVTPEERLLKGTSRGSSAVT